jgi:hypothetical protein
MTIKLVIDGTVEAISTRQDGTLKVTIGTQELDANQAGQLFGLRGEYIKALLTNAHVISPVEQSIVEQTEIQDGRKLKTKSQRLRAVLYRRWEQMGKEVEFDIFYDNYMEGLIENEKSKLD